MLSITRSLVALLSSATLLSPTLAAEPARAPRNDTLARCSWERPGRNPYQGDVAAAIDRYRDIPTPVRMKLKQRMAARDYDDLVDIRRDRVEGKFQYAAAIRDMHFAGGRVCREVSRARWTDKMHERGLVYCESEHCILVPTVCRNVSRVDRALPLVAGDRLLAPPGGVPAEAVSPGDRQSAATTPAERAAAAAAPPIASSFAESVAGAAVPLFPVPADPGPLGGGSLPGGVIALPPGGDAPPASDPGALPFPPVIIVPGGGGPVVVLPPDAGGGGGGGGGVVPVPVPIDPAPPPVTPIPEPSTWALLLAGLGMVAWTLRRQRRAGISAAR
jgi:hypothetical protein